MICDACTRDGHGGSVVWKGDLSTGAVSVRWKSSEPFCKDINVELRTLSNQSPALLQFLMS